MHTASYEFLMKPKESAGYHQTLSAWVGSGDETNSATDPLIQLLVPTGENTIGRSEECDVCIAAKSLSRTHATLLVDGETHFIQDLGSRNKTYRGKVSNWDTSKDGHYEAS